MSKSVTPFPSLSEWGDDESQRHLHIENHRKHEDTHSGAGHVTLDVEHRGQAILHAVSVYGNEAIKQHSQSSVSSCYIPSKFEVAG